MGFKEVEHEDAKEQLCAQPDDLITEELQELITSGHVEDIGEDDDENEQLKALQ